jgi:outer membrane murein-binding lipoprotein Lpp
VTADESTAHTPSGESISHPGMVRVKVRVRRSRRRRRRLVVLGVLVVVVLAGAALALLAGPLVSAKHEALAAQSDLTAAKAALAANDVDQARAYVRQARAHVARARRDAHGLGGNVWSAVPVAGTAVDDERHLIAALDQGTAVAELGLQVYPLVSGDSATLVQGQRIDVAKLRDVADRTSAIGPHLERALSELDQVKGTTPFVGSRIGAAKTTALQYLTPLKHTYDTDGPLIRALPQLVGAGGPRTYLLAMLNPSELRYSGGAALSFTTLRFDHGVASFGATRNVEDFQGPGAFQTWDRVPGNVFHRQPTQRVVNATFSPWWSVSAEELLRGYSKAFPGPRFDGFIGIDLQGLANLFKLTGPINMPPVGQIDSGNLVKVLGGSYARFSSTEQRHRLNAELVPAFRKQFFEGGRMQEKVKSLASSAQGRHFVVYFRDRAVEQSFGRAGLTGDLSRSPYDYLGVFSQNLNGSKNDYFQHREVTEDVQVRPNGSATAHLHVQVTNRAPAYSLPGKDPRFGYNTGYLGTLVALFLPRRSTVESTRVDGRPADLAVHFPKVTTVLNRKYVDTSFLLDHGQSATFDATYRIRRAAQVLGSRSMTYHLDIDPQDLVDPQVFHITVTWPDGYHAAGALPPGWKATRNGAWFDGPVSTRTSWAVPLVRG